MTHSKINRALCNERGSSTIEIIITLIFIAMALPALLQLFSSGAVDSAAAQVEASAIVLCNKKMEEIITDKLSLTRGFTYVITPGQYPAESISGGFTRTVTADTVGKSFSGISYALVTVSVSNSLIPTVQIQNWLTQY